jgi:hypothetical protein
MLPSTAENANLHGFPVSPLFEVRETASSGRGVFALQDIGKGTRLLETSTPAAWVIYDEYVKEVCAQCFAYDRGKAWKIRDALKGIAFCNQECQAIWVEEIPHDQSVARDEIQKILKRKRKAEDDRKEQEIELRKTLVSAERHWENTERMAEEIRTCREIPEPTKKQRKILQAAQDNFVNSWEDSYVVWYMFEGLVHRISNLENWRALENLVEDSSPYKETGDLNRSSQAYLMLLAVVPQTLLPYITQSAARSLQGHSSHNVFGLRSLGEGGEEGDSGSECFGYGLWPIASYWNHSCAPNVQKGRRGRTWKFWASRDIMKGEELCISYLGGDERDDSLAKRKSKLKGVWGFECACSKCLAETKLA